MSNGLFVDLEWLPRTPDDFTAQCRHAINSEDVAARLRMLASYSMDENQLNRLAKVLGQARELGKALTPLIPIRLGIIGNATTQFIVPALEATAVRYGFNLEVIEANFDQAMQEALSPDSAINRARPDLVLIAIDHHGLALQSSPGDAAAAVETVNAAREKIDSIREGIKKNCNAVCIVQTLPRPVETEFGSFDAVLAGTQRRLIEAFNRSLAESVHGTEDLLLDVAGIAETVGLADWHDTTLWNMAKLPFANVFLPLYAEYVCRLVAAKRGRSRRCLILDLDNTVWGGVIGDDGLEGIVVGQGNATGEAHLDVQRTALALRRRGVVLAVSSKNDDDVARLPFQKHPEMLLREEHIVVFQANWNDKATNIRAIAQELSLGLDAMVFLDDNPAERKLVREMLPQVAVPELPENPALYARTLLAAGYFCACTFSDEDRNRAQFYGDNARRVALQKQTGDLSSYLESLEMVMTTQPFDSVGRSRITQLINKSNQFNLTTRRYTEAEVESIENDPHCFHLQVRLADTFGDNGMISALVCRQTGSDWDITTWLMSCRVLGRKVENAVLNEVMLAASERGIRRIIGTYIPTERNKLVEDHYAKLGFTEIERLPDGTTRWSMHVNSEAQPPLPIKVIRLGFEKSRLAA